ncbi:MAG TPA: hypothetical protein VEZ52_08495 [Desulfovibrio sp.]|uniref:hypothetical protein n=1 Tax=Desulfovibrio sp. TaxID=885 RepID=UPI002D47E520|nr:hypothetical protein [Desulfovibrio sp.]HZF61645.1 hypothetical protein [Desulfovibrio sp.]
MTLPYSPSRAVYEGNGAATAFPFAFKVWNTDQLNISVTSPKGETSPAQGWTASIGESGGTVTYLHDGAPLPAGWRLAIVRNMPFAQGIDLISASRFDPQVIEDGLDQATAELQQLNEKLARAVIMPATSDKSPEEVVASIYASRDAAAQNATAAAHSAAAAAASAVTAAQTVTEAAEASVSAATAQADIAAANAQTAQTAAHAAQQAVPDNLLSRMANAEVKNTQQDTRLDGVESGITAISTTLIGSVLSITAAEGYVPNGAVPADAAEYTRDQFRTFYDTYLVGGKLLTCPYADFAAQVALTGNCAKFAIDTNAQKFKVPLLKDGDSMTQAASAAELGKSIKAGLPNIRGEISLFAVGSSNFAPLAETAQLTAPFYKGAWAASSPGGTNTAGRGLGIDLSLSSAVFKDGITTVLDEQVRLRHFVVLASSQNSASVFDWSNYMAGLAGKVNVALDNLTPVGLNNAANYPMPSQRIIAVTTPASTGSTAPAPAPGWFRFSGVSTAANQYARLSTNNFALDELSWSSGAGQTLGLIIPVRKGDVARVEYTAPTNPYTAFVFAEGAN